MMWFVCSKNNDDIYCPLGVYSCLNDAITALNKEFAYIPYNSMYLFESLKEPLICHMVDKKLFIS